MPTFHGNAIPSAADDYDIPYSCRFEKRTNTKLNRTFDHSTSYTVSCWVKRCNMSFTIGSFLQYIYRFGANDHLGFNGTDLLSLERYPSAGLYTNRYMRDPAAWYHIVIRWDTTHPTAADRIRIYVNGTEETYATSGNQTDPALNLEGYWNGAYTHRIGKGGSSTGDYDGLMAEWYMIDGMSIGPEYFGETNALTNQWQPTNPTAIKQAVTFGTNGYYLPFSNDALATSFPDNSLGTVFTPTEAITIGACQAKMS